MRSAICVTLLLIVPSVVSAQWYDSYERGIDAVKAQQWENVVRQMSDAITDKDEEKANAKTYGLRFIDYFPYVYRGMAYYELGQYQKALDDLQRSQQIGAVQDAAKDDDARKILARYLQLVDTKLNPSARLANEVAAAVERYNQADYDAAKNAFEKILAADPANADAKKYLKLIDGQLQKAETAKKEKTKQERIAEDFNAGISSFNQKNIDEAEKKFTSVLGLDANHTGAKDYMQRIRNERDRVATVRKEFQQGVAFFDRGAYPGAKRLFESVLQKESTHAGAQSYLQRIAQREDVARLMTEGERLLQSKQPDQAEEKFLAVIAKDRNNTKARNYVEAIKKSRSGTQIAERVRTLISEGMAFAKRGDYLKAREKFQGAQLLEANNADAARYLASMNAMEEKVRRGLRSYFQGEYEESIKQLVEVSQSEIPATTAYAYLACSYAAQYFMTGKENDELHGKAISAYQKLKSANGAFRFDPKIVSPKIISLLITSN